MNEIQRRLNCLDCYRHVPCIKSANYRLKRYNNRKEIAYYSGEDCKGFLQTGTALALIDAEHRIIRNYPEEVQRNYIDKMSDEKKAVWHRRHNICKTRKKLGRIGLGFNKGVLIVEASFLGIIVGSWSQRGGGGYLVLNLEKGRYAKASSFKTLEEMMI